MAKKVSDPFIFIANYKINGKSMISVEPLLGLTASNDLSVKRQELQWLLRYTGADGNGLVISQEWIKPGDFIDKNIRRIFLPILSEYTDNALWNIFYDLNLAVEQRHLGKVPDFSNEKIWNMWISDMDYFEANYFNHRQYWRLRGKPVLYIWNVAGIRNSQRAFKYARQKQIYILGDTLNPGVDNPQYMSNLPPMDGVTGFLVANGHIGNPPTLLGGPTTELFKHLFKRWHQETLARKMDFIPASSSQYDDTEFAGLLNFPPKRILARNAEEIKTHLMLAIRACRPIEGTNYVFWGTANNWAEGTTLLPTRLDPPNEAFCVNAYKNGVYTRRIGNYGFRILELIQSVMFESDYRGPIIDSEQPRLSETLSQAMGNTYLVTVSMRDCDVMGELALNKTSNAVIGNPPDLKTMTNLGHLKNFRFQWEALVTVTDNKPASFTIKFQNLDGRSVEHKIEIRPGE